MLEGGTSSPGSISVAPIDIRLHPTYFASVPHTYSVADFKWGWDELMAGSNFDLWENYLLSLEVQNNTISSACIGMSSNGNSISEDAAMIAA